MTTNTTPAALTVRSTTRPERWEDAMVSGNGVSGFMDMGGTDAETLIVCHEKCWIEQCDVERRVVNIQSGLDKARPLALAEKFKEGHEAICEAGKADFRKLYEGESFCDDIQQLPCNTVHPALHFLLKMDATEATDYERINHLETGEVITRWTDAAGRWERAAFTSRTDGVIVVRLRGLDGQAIARCDLSFISPPAQIDADVKVVHVQHAGTELYYHSVYSRTAGKAVGDGYHVLANVSATGGNDVQADGDQIVVTGAAEIVVVLKVDFLDEATTPAAEPLRAAVAAIATDYDALLGRHAAVHQDMMTRVRLDLGANFGGGASSEDILAESETAGMTPAFAECLFAAGRNAFISSSGECPPALMGIWSNDWDAPWGGRFTLDSNLNLAVAAGNQGDMHEAMETYFGFIERMLPDWRENAKTMFGVNGLTTALVQDWRTGKTPWYRYVWLAGSGWLYSYFWDYYQYTGDETFLADRVIPALIEIARLFEEISDKMPRSADGKRMIYPGISPENHAISHDGAWNFPNAAVDVGVSHQVLDNLIAGCQTLGIHEDQLPHWRQLRDELPDYTFLDDGAIAEWCWPGVEPREEHRHASHLYGVYPGTEISGRKTPELAKAALQAIQRRIDGGCSATSGHGLLHHMFFCARLLDADMFWHFMDAFATSCFMNTSMISNHNPNRGIYNLDPTFSLPAIITEAILYSEPGYIHLLPVAGKRLKTGRITGVLARGGIRVDEFTWDITTGVLSGRITSKTTQTIDMFGPPTAEGEQRWRELGTLQLPAGETVAFRFE